MPFRVHGGVRRADRIREMLLCPAVVGACEDDRLGDDAIRRETVVL
jgi:hypothetical protein